MSAASTESSRLDRHALESRVGLATRLSIALLAAAAIGIGAERLLVGVVDSFAVRGMLAVAAAAVFVGIAVWAIVVIPLSRTREDLHQRYRTALANSLSDPLTGLGNHRAFQEELGRQVEAARRYRVPLALVIIDLDRFKQINDHGGHAAGDRALAYFGGLLADSVRRPDHSYRIGGDEFAVLLPHTDAVGARTVVRRLLAIVLQQDVRREGQPDSPISFSAGISALPEPATTRAQLYSQADAALYEAKRSGRTDVLVFDPASAPEAPPPGAGPALAEVIARGQLSAVYQPIVDLSTGDILGVEGLIRPAATTPFANPGALFRAAAASGHTVDLDLACFETVVDGAARLRPGLFLSINLSPTTIEASDFSPGTLAGIAARRGLSPDRIVLELTEHEEITNLARVRDRLEACRGSGMRLAADDVGAGNAGLRLLSEVRFDIIKVDLGLVRRSVASQASSAVIESVVSLAGRTGAMVIGEGIETPEEVAQLTSIGVPAGQGFLLGRPSPLADELLLPLARGAAVPVAASIEPDDGLPPLEAWRQSIGLPTSGG